MPNDKQANRREHNHKNDRQGHQHSVVMYPRRPHDEQTNLCDVIHKCGKSLRTADQEAEGLIRLDQEFRTLPRCCFSDLRPGLRDPPSAIGNLVGEVNEIAAPVYGNIQQRCTFVTEPDHFLLRVFW